MERRRRGLGAALTLAALASLSCGEEAAFSVVEESIFCEQGELKAGRVSWREELFAGEESPLEGLRTELGQVEVPLDWCRADSERIQLSLRRISAEAYVAPTQPQIWLLVGGPGREGAKILDLAPFFAEQGFEVIVPDYRGVGASTPLQCEGDGSVDERCMEKLWLQWGEGLVHFSTTNIALDVGKVIESLRRPGQAVYLYGSSYGSYVGNRYLSLFPEQASGVILDGICPATGCDLHMDANQDRVLREVLELCAEDPFCSGKLGKDPAGRIAALLIRTGKGHCREALPEGDARVLERVLPATLVDPAGFRLGLSLAYRLERCEPEDVAAVRHLFEVFAPEEGEEHDELGAAHGGDSALHYANIVYSEFWDDSLAASLEAEREYFLFYEGLQEGWIEGRARWPWPLYRTPAELRSWASTRIPLLLLNGSLDKRTPVSGLEGLEAAFSFPNQSFHVIPWAGHVSLRSEPWGEEEGIHRCVGEMIRSFLFDPGAPVDSACLDTLEMAPLRGDAETAMVVYGTQDLWENPGFVGMSLPLLEAGAEGQWAHLRRLLSSKLRQPGW